MGTRPPDIKAFAFDLDGTLVDTEGHGVRGLHRFAHNMGWRVTPAEAQRHFNGAGIDQLVEAFCTHLGEGVERYRDRLPSLIDAAIRREYGGPVRPLPGAVNLLRALAAGRRLNFSVVSNSPLNVQLDKLGQSGLGGFVPPSRCTAPEHVRGRAKPNGEIYLHAIERMGSRPQETACVEDAPFGVMAGRDAGAITVGVHPDPEARKILFKAGADYVVASLHQLTSLFPCVGELLEEVRMASTYRGTETNGLSREIA